MLSLAKANLKKVKKSEVGVYSKDYGRLDSDSDFLPNYSQTENQPLANKKSDATRNKIETFNGELESDSKFVPDAYRPHEARQSLADNTFTLTQNPMTISDIIDSIYQPGNLKDLRVSNPQLDTYIARHQKKDFNTLMDDLLSEIKDLQKTSNTTPLHTQPPTFDRYKSKDNYPKQFSPTTQAIASEINDVVSELG